MHKNRFLIAKLLIVLVFGVTSSTCNRGREHVFTIAMDGKFSTLDPIGSLTVDANSERLRTLMYNSLVRKNENFEYVGDLAESFEPSADGLTYTFRLRKGVRFQDGKELSSADVKYTFDTLLKSEGGKASAFFETVEGEKKPLITSVSAPDALTFVLTIPRPEVKNQLIPNLVPIAIIPEGARVGEGSGADTKPPVGTGPYKFASYDTAQNIVELEAFDDHWEGAPNIKRLRVMILSDVNALQAELRAGRVDLAPSARNLSPETLKSLDATAELKVVRTEGSNIQYLWFNTEAEPVNRREVRRAVAYSVNRERIVSDLLAGAATLAYSILPAGSWAYEPGTKYDFEPEKAKKLLDDAGLVDSDGDGMREMPRIVLKISSASRVTQQYSQIIQSQLKKAGIPLVIESLEPQTMRSQVQSGQFILTTGIWVGGNQDPIFLKDLFASSEVPTKERASRNRGRYKNPEVDSLLENALKELDRDKAKSLYGEAQKLISEDLPLFPLWYPNNVIVASERVGNIKMNASGDWDFVRLLTLGK